MLTWRRPLAAAVLTTLVPLTACSGSDEQPRASFDGAAVWRVVRADLSSDPDSGDLRAFLVEHDGHLVLEKYVGTAADRYWDVESVTKSVISSLIGIAIGEGAISGVDATLADLLPTHRAAMSPAVARTTLHDVLSMSAGFPSLGTDSGLGDLGAADAVDRSLRHVNTAMRGTFDYSNEGAHVAGAILQQAVGMPVLEYARSRLFGPLGIDTRPAYTPAVGSGDLQPRAVARYLAAGFSWPTDPSGLVLGSTLLKLRPGDLMKIGLLYLHHGRWHGRQVVPESWTREATRVQSRGPNSAYGYFWWIGEADGAPSYQAQGYGGQLIEVVPSRRLVVVASTELSYLGDLGSDGLSPGALTFAVSDAVAPAVPH